MLSRWRLDNRISIIRYPEARTPSAGLHKLAFLCSRLCRTSFPIEMNQPCCPLTLNLTSKLLIIEFSIDSITLQEFFMIPSFYNHSLVENENEICCPDC